MPAAPTPRADPPPAGRRAELKARTRRDIVRAAAGLMDAHGVGFSVDDLATRAGVSRRTVFNHFPSLDDVVAAVGAGVFAAVRGALLAVDPPDGTLVDDLVGALRRADLVGPMASLTRGLGLRGAPDAAASQGDPVPAHQAMLLLKSMSDVSEDLATDLSRRHPAATSLDVDLAVAQVMGSLVVLHRHWFAATGAATDADARAVWVDMIDQLSPGAPARPSEGHHG